MGLYLQLNIFKMNNIYFYCIVFVFLLICELFYFKIADKFNIVDKPNERSSHILVTIRGGGILFWIAALIQFYNSSYQYPFFFIGLSSVTIISFFDDIFTLPTYYRLPIQIIGVCLLIFQLGIIPNTSLIILGILLIFGVAFINAYNFMDGINGITGGYSIVILGAFLFVNNFHRYFIDNSFIIIAILALFVFNFFNFRNKAVCFAGDVGSISISCIILFLLLKISILESNFVYVFFLAVYGVDSGLTIVQRLILKENILKAHRSHLFQLLANKLKMPHVIISLCYMFIQALLCLVIINSLSASITYQYIQGLFLVLLLMSVYILIKKRVNTVLMNDN